MNMKGGSHLFQQSILAFNWSP